MRSIEPLPVVRAIYFRLLLDVLLEAGGNCEVREDNPGEITYQVTIQNTRGRGSAMYETRNYPSEAGAVSLHDNETYDMGSTRLTINGISDEHRNDFVKGFTSKYRVHRLVWYEDHPTVPAAIHREKRLKKWKRNWKIALIEEMSPGWEDLYETLV